MLPIAKNLLTLLLGISCSFGLIAKPLFSTFPGTKEKYSHHSKGEEVKLLKSYNIDSENADKFEFENFIGDVSHFDYEIKNTATLNIFENYREAIINSGLDIIFECSNESCGKTLKEQNQLAKQAAYFNVYNYYRKPKYIYAVKKSPSTIAVSLFIGQYNEDTHTYLSTVDVKPIETGKIKANIDAYKKNPSNEIVQTKNKDTKGSKDHPLISRYPGASIDHYKQTDYDEFNFPISVPKTKSEPFDMLKVTGDITQITYKIKNVSTLKIYRNYTAALTKEGFETIFSCEKEQCTENQKKLQELGDHIAENRVYNYYRAPRYQVMKSAQGDQTIYVATFIGSYQSEVWVQLAVVRTEPLQKNLVEVNADNVIEQLKQKGKAAIYGIYFEYDKAEIKTESAAALEAIANVLKKEKNLTLYVVGHTDDTGKADYNLQLSKRRAAAVVEVLVTQYKISKSRLIPQGVGPYSPAATNRNDLGRQLNRRVELVEKLP